MTTMRSSLVGGLAVILLAVISFRDQDNDGDIDLEDFAIAMDTDGNGAITADELVRNAGVPVATAVGGALLTMSLAGNVMMYLKHARDRREQQQLRRRLSSVKREAGLKFPKNWAPFGDEASERNAKWWRRWLTVDVPRSQPEFDDVAGRLLSSMDAGATRVLRVQRIQDRAHWRRYAQKRAELKVKNGGDPNERKLWHGTSSTNPATILRSESGLDERMSSKGFYSYGIYLAEHAAYSNGNHRCTYFHPTPDGHRQLLLVTACLGGVKELGGVLARDLRAATDLVDAARSTADVQVVFDSVHGGPHRPDQPGPGAAGDVSSRMYVVYRNTQVYPSYLVTYDFDVSAGGMPAQVDAKTGVPVATPLQRVD